MNIVKIRIDDVHDLILTQSRESSGADYGYTTKTEAVICGPEGPYASAVKELKNTKELAEYILHYFGD
jgi:hypothetical protein